MHIMQGDIMYEVKVLIAEDETALRQMVVKYLKKERAMYLWKQRTVRKLLILSREKI